MIEELKEHKSLVIALVVVLSLTAAVILFVQGRTSETGTGGATGKTQDKESAAKVSVANGTLTVVPLNGRQIYESDETVSLALRGDSNGQDAVGFDAALKVDQNILVFSQAESKLENFDTFNNVNEERVYIGGIRKLSSKAASIFDNAELATLTFKARAGGHSNVDFIFKPNDTTESNIVLTTSKDGLGDVKGTDIYVGEKITVTTASSVVLPSTNFKIALKDVTTESANLDISLGDASEPKKFTWGPGGTVSKNVETSAGYVFQVEKGSGNSVNVYYAVQKTLN